MQLSQCFTEALVYTTALHHEQNRKVSGSPYVAHLLRVAGIVLEYGATEDEAIAALLHDAIEDQGGATTREEIRCRFGDQVAAMVEGCTDADTTPKPPWRKRKEAHVDELRHASASVRLIVAADKLDNARSLLQEYRIRGERLWDYFHGRRDGTLWYYRAMVDALRAADTSPLVDEVARTVGEIERIVGGEE